MFGTGLRYLGEQLVQQNNRRQMSPVGTPCPKDDSETEHRDGHFDTTDYKKLPKQ